MIKNIENVCNEKPSEASDISAKLGIPKSTKITEPWVIQDVRKKCGSGNYDDYTVLVMDTMEIDTSDAYKRISEEGIAGYINMRMKEVEKKLRYATTQGEDSEVTMKQVIKILKMLRSIDYRIRTPKEGMPVLEPQTHIVDYTPSSENGVSPKPEGRAMPVTYFRLDGAPTTKIHIKGHDILKGRK